MGKIMKNKSKIISAVIFLVIAILIYGIMQNYVLEGTKPIEFGMEINSDVKGEYELFYKFHKENQWFQENSMKEKYDEVGTWKKIKYNLPSNVKGFRLDLGDEASNIKLRKLYVKQFSKYNISNEGFSTFIFSSNQLENVVADDNYISIKTAGQDPHLIFKDIDDLQLIINSIDNFQRGIIVILSILLALILTVVIKHFKVIIDFISCYIKNFKLTTKLAQNDFKTKYVSSYLGGAWGFIQPLITILVYWFVFQVGFKSTNVKGAPFILWFIAGIVPWFFFAEAFQGASNSFFEYSYLVKKVVFKIEILPMIKIISAAFAHVFFIIFIFAAVTIYGYKPTLYNLQIFYYLICLGALLLSFSIFTSAVVLFFRDLNQIIGIILNIGFWFTPICWSTDILPAFWVKFFKLNPMYYIVEGYRDTFITNQYFWQRPYNTLYFWLVCLIMMFVSVKIFNKLKIHFSEVL